MTDDPRPEGLRGPAARPDSAGPGEAWGITEFDLLAYADGRLEGDPARLALIERHLAANPEQAERIADFRAQTEALARAGAAWLETPMPQRLLDIVGDGRPEPRRFAAKAAAIAALAAVSATAGWLAGADRPAGVDPTEAFAASALVDYRQTPRSSGQGAVPLPWEGGTDVGERHAIAAGTLPANDLDPQSLSHQGLAPMTWLRRRIAVEIDAPDLGAEGFSLVDTGRIEMNGEAALRLAYRRGGQRAVLYVRPRWKQEAGSIRRTESAGVTVLHWLEGPLAIALVTEGADKDETEVLADRVRRTIARTQLIEPRPEPTTSQDARLTTPSIPGLRPLGDGPAPAAEPPL